MHVRCVSGLHSLQGSCCRSYECNRLAEQRARRASCMRRKQGPECVGKHQSMSHPFRDVCVTLATTYVWDVAAVCDVPDTRQGHLLGEGLSKAGQAL
jgi:hypothetical protein